MRTIPVIVLFLLSGVSGMWGEHRVASAAYDPLAVPAGFSAQQVELTVQVEAITKNPAWETTFLLMEGTSVGVTMKKR